MARIGQKVEYSDDCVECGGGAMERVVLYVVAFVAVYLNVRSSILMMPE